MEYQGIIAGIGDKDNNINLITPQIDAKLNDYILGKNAIIDGLEILTNVLTAGTCVLCGYKGVLRSNISISSFPTYIYGKFVLYFDNNTTDEFYIELTNETQTVATEITGAGTYYLLLYTYTNGNYVVNTDLYYNKPFPKLAYWSNEADNLNDNGEIAASAEAITQDIGDNSSRVATTEYVQNQIGHEINVGRLSGNLYNITDTNIGTFTVKRKAKLCVLQMVFTGSGNLKKFLTEGFLPKNTIYFIMPFANGSMAVMYSIDSTGAVTTIGDTGAISDSLQGKTISIGYETADDARGIITKSITSNGTYRAMEEQNPAYGYSQVTVNVPTNANLQAQKQVSVSDREATITPDEGYDGIEQVKVTVGNNFKTNNNEEKTATTAELNSNSGKISTADTNDNTKFYNKIKVPLTTKIIKANGVSIPSSNYVGFSSVTVRVPQANIAPKPETINANGQYQASTDSLDGYSQVTVNVQPDLITKTITENGTYAASSENKDGYSQVTVNIPSSATPTLQNKTDPGVRASTLNDIDIQCDPGYDGLDTVRVKQIRLDNTIRVKSTATEFTQTYDSQNYDGIGLITVEAVEQPKIKSTLTVLDQNNRTYNASEFLDPDQNPYDGLAQIKVQVGRANIKSDEVELTENGHYTAQQFSDLLNYYEGLSKIYVNVPAATQRENLFISRISGNSVNVPDAIVRRLSSIKAYAFSHFGYVAMDIPYDCQMLAIEDHAFEYCNVNINIKKGFMIDSFAFRSALGEVVLASNELGGGCFNGFAGILTLYGNIITYEGVFSNANISELIIDNISVLLNEYSDENSNPLKFATNVYYISDTARENPITEITIPDGTSTIPDLAFANFQQLEAVTLPSSITKISKKAFYNCQNLSSITILATIPPALEEDDTIQGSNIYPFDGVDANCKIYVPSNSVNDYENAFPDKYYNMIYPIRN